VISVQGSHTARFPAERASVFVTVSIDGPVRDEVVAAATAAAEAVRATIEPLHQPGPITSWSADSLRVWSQRPWSQTGEQLDPVHSAALDLTATFSDFSELSGWIERVVTIEHVAIGSIQWSLTDATVTTVTAEVRSRAVKDAVSKASVYAQSIGLGSVTATAIADPGMLGDSAPPQPGFEPREGARGDAGLIGEGRQGDIAAQSEVLQAEAYGVESLVIVFAHASILPFGKKDCHR